MGLEPILLALHKLSEIKALEVRTKASAIKDLEEMPLEVRLKQTASEAQHRLLVIMITAGVLGHNLK